MTFNFIVLSCPGGVSLMSCVQEVLGTPRRPPGEQHAELMGSAGKQRHGGEVGGREEGLYALPGPPDSAADPCNLVSIPEQERCVK